MAWFWRILGPTFRVLTYTVLFNVIGKVQFQQGELPYVFVLAAGFVPWQLISGVISGSVAGVSSNASFYGKVYFPRIILPIVAVTAYPMSYSHVKAFAKGCNEYMRKPIDMTELAELVNRYLAAS